MAEFIFPMSAELDLIAQDKLPRLTAQRPVFDIFPIRNQDSFLVMWEQKDNYPGLQQVRGLNEMPARVTKVGAKRYQMLPGVYGEFIPIDELELTTRRQWGQFAQPTDITDLVMDAQDHLLQRRLDRIENIVWTLLTTGTFSVSSPTGAIDHTDTYNTQTFTASTTWATAATSTPLADFRSVKLLARGHSVDFGAAAKAYMNQVTFNNLIMNNNSNDLFGRRTTGLQTINNLPALNQLLAGDDLPQIVVYDQGYLADPGGAFTLYIPNNKVVVVGQRPNNIPVGEYRMVRNANNQNLAPGAYQKVIDHGDSQVPRKIEVHDGHNGGPALLFPSAIVTMSV